MPGKAGYKAKGGKLVKVGKGRRSSQAKAKQSSKPKATPARKKAAKVRPVRKDVAVRFERDRLQKEERKRYDRELGKALTKYDNAYAKAQRAERNYRANPTAAKKSAYQAAMKRYRTAKRDYDNLRKKGVKSVTLKSLRGR